MERVGGREDTWEHSHRCPSMGPTVLTAQLDATGRKAIIRNPRHCCFWEAGSFQTPPVGHPKCWDTVFGMPLLWEQEIPTHVVLHPHPTKMRLQGWGGWQIFSEAQHRKAPSYTSLWSEDPAWSVGFPELNISILQGHRSSCKARNRLKECSNTRHACLFSQEQGIEKVTPGSEELQSSNTPRFSSENTHSFSISPW